MTRGPHRWLCSNCHSAKDLTRTQYGADAVPLLIHEMVLQSSEDSFWVFCCLQSLEAVSAAQASLADKGTVLPASFVQVQQMRPARERNA